MRRHPAHHVLANAASRPWPLSIETPRGPRRVPVSFPAHFPRTSFAAATTLSDSNPNFFSRSFSGADAPKLRIPTILPLLPAYRSHPNVDAISTDTRAVTLAGSTLSL